ncbi:SDR family oxidoreductase [Parasphingopyxis marina]|uniref:SDR family oxidoreductase n=1 Tax=Parasphingopyxis marina TaxID=2761622 RepID=A0A842HY85_9SPHN|nr:SDR family oxidoreductase [Parasphingopyxis marina]MBC2779158.1 SDR family oxidoreductase [Parasphingopyxis marina]
MKVVVIGGTGLVGSKLVQQLNEAGHEGIAASRATGVDTLTGEGLGQVLPGAEVVIDVSNPGYSNAANMLRFFEVSGANLLPVEREFGIAHHVTLSAVGVGRVNSGYFVAKGAQEKLVGDSGLPFTIVRSTPLSEYVYNIVDAGGDGDLIRLPPVRIQPITANDVAKALKRVALGAPTNGIIEIAGPDTYRLPVLAEQILTANEDSRRIIVDDTAPYFGARVGDEPLTGGDHPRFASTSFEDWLRRSFIPAGPHPASPQIHYERTLS